MAKYHINSEGNPKPCSAKNQCPFGDMETKHYLDIKEAQSIAEQKLAEKFSTFSSQQSKHHHNSPTPSITSKKELIEHSVSSEITIDHSEGAANKQVIDSFEYNGKTIEVTNENNSTDDFDELPQSKGFHVSHLALNDSETGREIGFIKYTHMTDESFQKAFGNDAYTIFRYKSKYPEYYGPYRGSSFTTRKMEEAETDEERLEAKKELWVIAMYPDKVSTEDAPESEEEIDMSIAMFSETDEASQKEIAELKASFKDPYVDYISVTSREDRGQAYGSSLYIYAAKALGENNQKLRASGIQSDDAKRSWERMKKEFPNNIRTEQTINEYNEEETNVYLDFRRKI